MTEQIKAEAQEAEVPGSAVVDQEAADNEPLERIAQLEECVAARDAELATLKDSLAGAAARYREAVLAGAPGVPAELVGGDTLEEIDASLETAAAIVSNIKKQLEAEATAQHVPAGAPPRTPPDLSALSPVEKIALALSRQRT
jgi:hypothetical protein